MSNNETRMQRLVRLTEMAGKLYMRDLVEVSTGSNIHLNRYRQLATAAREEWNKNKRRKAC